MIATHDSQVKARALELLHAWLRGALAHQKPTDRETILQVWDMACKMAEVEMNGSARE